MTSREELVEEAAKALTGLTDAEWEIATAEGTDHLTGYFEAAERVWVVFEQAHTPTAHPAHSGHEYGGGYARAAALAAGDPDWMNATGGTPTDDEREAIEAETERLWPTDRDYSVAQTAPVFSVKELDAYCASAFTRGARFAVGLRRTVQDEPTDAQVSAFMKTFWEYAPPPGAEARVRAALRAAAAVREEGEPR